MEHLQDSQSYLTWLLGQSVAVVLLAAWVTSLHRQLKKSFETNQDLHQRNSELVSSLVDVVQSSSQERAQEKELNLRTVLDAFEKALHHKVDE